MLAPGGYTWQLNWVLHLTSDLGHFIWQVVGVYLAVYLGTSSHIWSWSLHLTSCGGISDSLRGYFISHLILVTSSEKLWGVYLTAYLGTSSHIWSWSLHLTSSRGYIWALHLKTWPNSAICFERALIDSIDQWRPLLLALAVLSGGYIWEHYLKIWTHFRFDSCFTEVFSTKDQQEMVSHSFLILRNKWDI